MRGSGFAIATRQKDDLLVHLDDDDRLVAGASFTSDIRGVSGYQALLVLVSSDQAFTVSVREACFSDGQFVQASSFASALVGARHVVCEAVEPCGNFARTVITNTGAAQQSLAACVQGLPQP
jgi:hypothetical protein